MISAEEKLQVENYLISKKLPLDILLEVKDHMISQIEDKMKDDKIGFEEAFLKVELSWRDNFSLTKYWFFSGHERIPKFVKEMMKRRLNPLIFKSIILGFLYQLISVLLVFFIDSEAYYKIAFLAINYVMFILAISVLIIYLVKKKWYDRKYKEVSFTLFQRNLAWLVPGILSAAQLLNYSKYQWAYFRTNIDSSLVNVAIGIGCRFLIYSYVLLSLFIFFEHKKALKKLQFVN